MSEFLENVVKLANKCVDILVKALIQEPRLVSLCQPLCFVTQFELDIRFELLFSLMDLSLLFH